MTASLVNISKQFRRNLERPFSTSKHLANLLFVIEQNGGCGLLVGGCVRDYMMGLTPKDIDIEVYGIAKEKLEAILSQHFSIVSVGKAFGIFKVTVGTHDDRETIDVALPRTENKSGRGHKGFVVETDPHMPFAQASSRRDFTINAMGIDTTTNELLDPHNGFADLSTRTLRHVSAAFVEDPLRVLRAAQFCARFELALDASTAELCRSLRDELPSLSKERIFEEFKKLMLSPKPSLGLHVLRDVDALGMFPQLAQLIGCKQDPEWHPEGDVWIHSLMVVDQAARLVDEADLDETSRMIVVFGALCHDFGKPLTTILKDGRVKSPAHDVAGVEPTLEFLAAIAFPKKWHDDITSLVREHLKPYQLYRTRDEVSDGALSRLACRVNIDHLLLVAKADFLGRTTPEALSGYDPSVVWLKEKLTEILGAQPAPTPLLLGRHLIALGEKPGAHFSEILRAAFEAQLDGAFNDENGAVIWAKAWLKDRT